MPKTLAPTGRSGLTPSTESGRSGGSASGASRVAGREVSTREERIQKLEALDEKLLQCLKALGLIFGEIHLINASKCVACHGSLDAKREVLKKQVEAKEDEKAVDAKDDTDKSPQGTSLDESLDKLTTDVSRNLEQIKELPKLMELVHKHLCTGCQKELEERSEYARFSIYR